ncbi:MAG TPA: hypothetical protein VF114_00480, partial [Candidatus Limnocylindria bacterium]
MRQCLHRVMPAAIVMFLVACAAAPQASGPSASTAATASATAAGDPDNPVGIIAMGHSGMTGEGTAALGEPAP